MPLFRGLKSPEAKTFRESYLLSATLLATRHRLISNIQDGPTHAMVTSRMAPILAIAITLVSLEHVKASVSLYNAASTPTENIDSNRKGQNDYFEDQQSRSLSERLHVDPLPDGPMEKGDPKFAAPEQVHIALAVSASREHYAMTVAWTTWPETASHVLWGETEDTLSNMAEGNATCESSFLS